MDDDKKLLQKNLAGNLVTLKRPPTPTKIDPNFFRSVCDQAGIDEAETERHLTK